MLRQEVRSIIAEDFLSVCVTDEKTYTHTRTSASLKPIPQMYYFVQLFTHHHLQSAQALPPFELRYLFSSRLLSPPSASLSLAVLSTVGFVTGLPCIQEPIYLLFPPLILSYCHSQHPTASGTRPPQEFCSLCPRHESLNQDNDEELRHTADQASITDRASKHTPLVGGHYYRGLSVCLKSRGITNLCVLTGHQILGQIAVT